MIPQSQNDRLLELAGGCRHVWRRVNEPGEHPLFVCHRCGCEDYTTCAVGDGHQMTLGEMVRLAAKLWKYADCAVWPTIGVDEYASKWTARLYLSPGREYRPIADTPEAALAAAIIAAKDGAK